MMQKINNQTKRIRLLSSILFMGAFVFSSAPLFATAVSFQANISIPAQSLDFSDLDVRDGLNRASNSQQTSTDFSNFVSAVLNKSLLQNLTPNNRLIQTILNLKWDVISGWIKQAAQKAEGKIHFWLAQSKKARMVLVAVKTVMPLPRQNDVGLSAHNNFLYLISSLLSSTQILR